MRSRIVPGTTGTTIAVQGSSIATSATSDSGIRTISDNQLASKIQRLQIT
jgi:hypothetical protein